MSLNCLAMILGSIFGSICSSAANHEKRREKNFSEKNYDSIKIMGLFFKVTEGHKDRRRWYNQSGSGFNFYGCCCSTEKRGKDVRKKETQTQNLLNIIVVQCWLVERKDVKSVNDVHMIYEIWYDDIWSILTPVICIPIRSSHINWCNLVSIPLNSVHIFPSCNMMSIKICCIPIT